MAGLVSGGMGIGAGGALADTGMDIDMGMATGIDMDTGMGIVMAIMQEEEPDIAPDQGILHKAIFIKTGQMEFGTPEPDLRQDPAMLVQDLQIRIRGLQHNHQILQRETGRQLSQLSQEPEKTMCILIKAGMFTRGTIAVAGLKGAMDSGIILLIPVQAREAVQAI